MGTKPIYSATLLLATIVCLAARFQLVLGVDCFVCTNCDEADDSSPSPSTAPTTTTTTTTVAGGPPAAVTTTATTTTTTVAAGRRRRRRQDVTEAPGYGTDRTSCTGDCMIWTEDYQVNRGCWDEALDTNATVACSALRKRAGGKYPNLEKCKCSDAECNKDKVSQAQGETTACVPAEGEDECGAGSLQVTLLVLVATVILTTLLSSPLN